MPFTPFTLVSRDGISPNPESVSAVQNWPRPVSSKEVEKFLGFMNYHRAHIKDFAKLARPLYELTKKNVQFAWSDKHDIAFEALRHELTTSPVLSFPKNDKEDVFILDTDASDTAIGAELVQMQNGVEKVICYGTFSGPKEVLYDSKGTSGSSTLYTPVPSLLTRATILRKNGSQ